MSRMSRLNSTLFREPAVEIWQSTDTKSKKYPLVLDDDNLIVSSSVDILKYNTSDMSVEYTISGYGSISPYVKDSSGNIWGCLSDRVFMFNPKTGTVIREITDYSYVLGVAVDSVGNIAIVRDRRYIQDKTVVFLNADGVEQWYDGFNSYSVEYACCTFDSSDKLVVFAFGLLRKYNSDGTKIINSSSSSNNYASALVCDKNDNIYIIGYSPSYSTLRKISPDGSALWHTYPFITISGNGSSLFCAEDGNILAVRTSSTASGGYAAKISSETGRVVWRIAKNYRYLGGFCTDNKGKYYLTNYYDSVGINLSQWREY